MMTIRGKWNEAPRAVTLIDAHHHLWDLNANRYPFLTDQPEPHFFLGSYDAIKRKVLHSWINRMALAPAVGY